jgi:trehalose 6-phosphate synthase
VGGANDKVNLVVVSNRGPLTIESDADGNDRYRRGSGGLVSAIGPALSSSGAGIWVCAPMTDRERSIARHADGGRLSAVPEAAEELRGEFDVMWVPIEAATFRGAYNGIANATLWFVLHMLFETARTPVFDARWRRQWAAYERYNTRFADAVDRVAAEDATVMVQDYHLFLLPGLLRARRPDLRIGLFTHTPWVSPDYFQILPADVCSAILTSMSAADLLGFHTRRWLNDFRRCCQAVLGGEPESELRVFGLTTDADEIGERGHRRDVDAAARRLSDEVGDRQIIGRVDRAELSKNVLRGLLAFRELLVQRPEWRDRVVHVIVDNPSREELAEYRSYTHDVQDLADAINDEFGTDTWTPVLLTIEHDYVAALACMRRTDVLLINPVRDGMNLVVFEGIVLADHDPAVVLSEHAGAAELLADEAILINPFDVSQTTDALHRALSMPAAERATRAQRLRTAATALEPATWFQAQLDALLEP